MHRTIRTVTSIAIVCTLGGCATFEGGPESVFDTQALVSKAKGYSVGAVDQSMESLASDAEKQRRLRNRVVRAYLTAIDAQYFDFRTDLGLEGRGGSFVFDVITLGLATAGALSNGAAPELAAAAGLSNGTRSAIDKNLLAEKTVPAIMATMDASRLRLQARITEKMSQSIDEYPMEEVWNDLQAYQLAGTFDEAVSHVTDRASADRASARAAFNRANGISCDAKADIVPLRTQLGDLLFAEYNRAESATTAAVGRGKLEAFARLFDVPATGTNREIAESIAARVNLDYCSADSLRQKIDLLSR